MFRINVPVRGSHRRQRGLMIEYVVILACAVVIAIAGLTFVGTQTSSAISTVSCGLGNPDCNTPPVECPQGIRSSPVRSRAI